MRSGPHGYPGLAAVCLALAGCGTAPVGEAIFGPEQRRAGAEAARSLEERDALVRAPALVGYLREVGSRLAQAAPEEAGPFEFNVVDMEEPNAFALPSGHVYVSRGLLALLNSEDELAGVVGHEIGHVVGRHHVKQAMHDAPLLPLRIATGISGALLSTVSPALGGLVAGTGRVTSALLHAPYSRDQEREADEIGQRLAAVSGWDPLGITHVMDALGAEEKLHGGDPRRQSFLATHPASAERSERTRRAAARLARAPKPPIAAGLEGFLARIEGLVVGTGAKQGVFEGGSFLHPELGFALRMPEPPDWKRENTADAVVALRENPAAAILLELAGEGDDPLAAAGKPLPEGARAESAAEPKLVNELPAARVRASLRGRGGPLRAEFWWIALDGRVYRITGMSDAQAFDGLSPQFSASAQSFHRLLASERNAIREDRLRSERARPGESLASILERVGSGWKPEEAAVANAVSAGGALEAGRLVKVTRPEPYRR